MTCGLASCCCRVRRVVFGLRKLAFESERVVVASLQLMSQILDRGPGFGQVRLSSCRALGGFRCSCLGCVRTLHRFPQLRLHLLLQVQDRTILLFFGAHQATQTLHLQHRVAHYGITALGCSRATHGDACVLYTRGIDVFKARVFVRRVHKSAHR